MATFDESENIAESARMPLWRKELIQRRKDVSKVILIEGKNDIFL